MILTGPLRVDPDLTLYLPVSVRLLRARDGEVLHSFTMGYRGPPRSFTQWGAANARAFREEAARGHREMAERIAEEIFSLRPMETRRRIRWRDHDGAVGSVAFAPKGARVASAGSAILVHEVGSDAEPRMLGQAEEGAAVAFTADGAVMAVNGSTGEVRVWAAQK